MENLEFQSFAYRGGEISYSITKAEKSKTPPIVLLHGLGASAFQWQFAVEPLRATRSVVLVDLPGHGKSALPEDLDQINFDGFCDIIIVLIEALNLPQVDVCGISMGSALAMKVATRAPSLVRSVLAIRPAWLDIASPTNLSIIARIGALLEADGVNGAKASLADDPEYRFINDEAPLAAASLMQAINRENAVAYAPVLRAMVADAPFERLADLRSLSKPVLVAACHADALHPMNTAKIIANSVRHATFEILPPRYLEPAEHQEALLKAMQQFLSIQSQSISSEANT